ncbi:hemolysin family protein [Benzoatithermus flavus]|uniref:Hemolysin family protein n=1 Tax=Benzoatithermus flavus TaxID=3108223 RepID=A0ABU8XT85_9PROT
MILSLAAVVLLLAANAFFVAAEFALVKVRAIRLETLAETGRSGARLAIHILKHLEAYLAACQLGITMASLGLGWVGEPAVSALLEPLFRLVGLDDTVLHTVSFIVGFLIFSSLHIVLGEQVPKTFAIRQPEPISLGIALPLHAFFLLCWPLNWALNAAARSVLRLLGVAEATHLDAYSGAELRQLIGASRQLGAMPKQEHDMLGAILDLEKVEVSEVMTHRRNIVSINADAPVEEIVRQVLEGPYTRYPLWRGDPDTIIGVLHAKDVLAAVQRQGAKVTAADLRKLATPPWFIPDTTSLVHQLLAFRQRRAHLAFVIDEYGALMGLVTLEDILEEIVGDIVDEKDVEMSGVKQEPDGSVLVEGRVTIRDLNRQFDWHLPDEEATTVAGLLMHEARRIPEVGESFVFHGFRFEVVRRLRHQLTLLRIRPEVTTPAEAE